MMPSVEEITAMQQAAIARWHRGQIDNLYTDFMRLACHQCSLNYLLWHEEDAARSLDAVDAEIAHVKRTIDQLNQQRNDYIERMDIAIAELLAVRGILAPSDAPLNTETPGSTIDRLSILALRLFHLEEQLRRTDTSLDHVHNVKAKLSVCGEQFRDLSRSLQQLLDDILGGRKKASSLPPIQNV